jgi:hypothetical protein
MADKTARLVNYVRNPTWISVNFLGDHTKDGGNFAYTEEEKKQFAEDPKSFLEYRKKLEGA